MLDAPGGELAEPCTDKASSPFSGLQRCQSTLSAEHGYIDFCADEQEALSIMLLHNRALVLMHLE